MRGKKREIPSLGLSLFLTYIHKMTRVNVTACRTAEACMEFLDNTDNISLPAGLGRECRVVLERKPYISQLWNFSPKTFLGQLCGELGHGEYVIVSDAGFTGIESLFLYASGLTDSLRFRQEDVVEIIKPWMMFGNPKIVTGEYTFKDSEPEPYMYAVGVQLVSMFRT